jgi:hypothetical protein
MQAILDGFVDGRISSSPYLPSSPCPSIHHLPVPVATDPDLDDEGRKIRGCIRWRLPFLKRL